MSIIEPTGGVSRRALLAGLGAAPLQVGAARASAAYLSGDMQNPSGDAIRNPATPG